MKFNFAAMMALALTVGCSPMVETTNVKDIEPEVLNKAAVIDVYMIGQKLPSKLAVIQPIEAFSCKHLVTDPPASTGDALLQLQLKALELDASAITNVTFDTRGTDTWGTNCWETVQASGLAVK